MNRTQKYALTIIIPRGPGNTLDFFSASSKTIAWLNTICPSQACVSKPSERPMSKSATTSSHPEHVPSLTLYDVTGANCVEKPVQKAMTSWGDVTKSTSVGVAPLPGGGPSNTWPESGAVVMTTTALDVVTVSRPALFIAWWNVVFQKYFVFIRKKS